MTRPRKTATRTGWQDVFCHKDRGGQDVFCRKDGGWQDVFCCKDGGWQDVFCCKDGGWQDVFFHKDGGGQDVFCHKDGGLKKSFFVCIKIYQCKRKCLTIRNRNVVEGHAGLSSVCRLC